jgi:predicted RNA-binding protein
MCLSKAYVVRNGNRELLMEEVASVGIKDDKLLFKSLFGEQKEVGASIREIDFLAHTILLDNLREGGG